jgi:hypothetical protein
MSIHSFMHVKAGRDGVVSRRGFLGCLAGTAAGGILGWTDTVAAQAEELRRKGMSCILLFMNGAPSQLETFDPKPGTATGGPTQAIETAVPGIRIADPWTKTAAMMKDIALIRSMTNKEGEHQRATYQLHTGSIPAGGVKHPSIGSVVASEIGPKEFDLPSFVSIGNRFALAGSGFLGAHYAPFVVANPLQLPSNVELPTGVRADRFTRRLGLLDDLENDFATSGGKPRVEEHRSLYSSASNMVLSPRLKSFDLNQEKDEVRDRYGRNPFGQGCLMARRLIEEGVTFVEVSMGGWDTHLDNFNRVKTLTQSVDPAFAALLADLKDRGRLDKTLVIWMGEFGRTPKINPNTGRDHYPKAFNVALAGGGVRGGQVIGSTTADGTEVASQPVSVADLFCTFYHSLGINPRKENMSSAGRPIKLVDGGKPVMKLFS